MVLREWAAFRFRLFYDLHPAPTQLYCDLDALLHKHFYLKQEENNVDLDMEWSQVLDWLINSYCVVESKVCKIINVVSLINVY